MGSHYDELHPHLKAAHEAPLTASGTVAVVGADRAIGRWIARILSLPKSGEGMSLEVEVSHSPDGQVWSRKFGQQSIVTRQTMYDGLMREISGPGTIEIAVSKEAEGLVYRSTRARWAGIPLPRPISPQVHATVKPTDQGWVAKVEISMPLFGRLCTYTAEITQWT